MRKLCPTKLASGSDRWRHTNLRVWLPQVNTGFPNTPKYILYLSFQLSLYSPASSRIPVASGYVPPTEETEYKYLFSNEVRVIGGKHNMCFGCKHEDKIFILVAVLYLMTFLL